MLPKRKRLSRHTFPKAFEGKKASSQHFSLVWGSSRHGGCAAVVSKKVAPLSVDRHLLKRRMVSVMGAWCSPSHFMVVYAKMGSETLSFTELSQELTRLLSHMR